MMALSFSFIRFHESYCISKLDSDVELMKERFSKLLLGEDMSGGGKGVSSALALSNAITNLAASVFGEQRKLEPMPPERKARWGKEIDWLLSVTDYIVEMVPSQQKSKDGVSMEIMTTRQRKDLHMDIPALRKLDAMLINCLDNFKDQNEFYYESKSDKGGAKREDDKWWLPTPKVPPNGLSDVSKKWLQFQKDSVNQVLKAAMAINAQVLSEMQIPENYIESLPKNGRSTLGDYIYKSITVEYFDPGLFLSTLDLSSEHKILELKDKIEASIVIWKRKMNNKDAKSSLLGSAVSSEKREVFEERAQTILLMLKQRFPGIPQSALDISKIQYNRDVGQAILESYSRVLESLAYTVSSRIEDVLHADAQARNPSETKNGHSARDLSDPVEPPMKYNSNNANEEIEKLNSIDASMPMTLSDFMGWTTADQGDSEQKKDPSDDSKDALKNDIKSKISGVISTDKKVPQSYIEKVENRGGSRSPTARD
uniref:PRONE domain-containing protein n=1 Tax=Kalanchoe fedtschenkoi TaxID=63787 RepID=A0A7N0TIY2_KALFE